MRRLSLVTGVLYLLVGAFVALSAVVLGDSVPRNAILGSVFAVIGAGLLALSARSRSTTRSLTGIVTWIFLALGVFAASGALFRVFVEGYAVFG